MNNFFLLSLLLIQLCFAQDYRKITTKTYATPNPNNRKEIITLIHINKEYLKSCKDALDNYITDPIININVNGTNLLVICDQTTDNGGWTRVLDRSATENGQILIPIDDLQLTYTEVLFKVKSGYLSDYDRNSAGQWENDGYNFAINALRFDETWYFSSDEVPDVGWNYTTTIQDYITSKQQFAISSAVTILTPSTTCQFAAINSVGFCAKEFIFTSLPSGRLNAISDVESITGIYKNNNDWTEQFEIYVR